MKTILHHWLGVACVVVASLSAGSNAQTPAATFVPALERIRQGEPLRVGYRANSPPLSFEKDGVASGYSVDVCRAAIIKLSAQLSQKQIHTTFVALTLDNRLTKVASGEVDMECGLTTNTVSRAKLVNFSPTTLVTGTRIVVRANTDFNAPQQLAGKTVAAGKGQPISAA